MKNLLFIILLLSITNNSFASDKAYLKFIHSENKRISKKKAKHILKHVKYFAPRYFEDKNKTEEGIIWTLAIMAHESSFRNTIGDGGKSIGLMQIQWGTCNAARQYNGITRKLNIINPRHNIWCGMANINRLYENLEGNWRLVLKGYNGGLGSVWYPERYKKANRMTDKYVKLVHKKRSILLKLIKEV